MSTTQIEVNVRPEVERGAEWLDAVHPGWDKHIDLTKLNIHSCEKCIVGQLWGYDAPHRDASVYSEELGFDLWTSQMRPGAYDKLTEEWRDLIASRR